MTLARRKGQAQRTCFVHVHVSLHQHRVTQFVSLTALSLFIIITDIAFRAKAVGTAANGPPANFSRELSSDGQGGRVHRLIQHRRKEGSLHPKAVPSTELVRTRVDCPFVEIGDRAGGRTPFVGLAAWPRLPALRCSFQSLFRRRCLQLCVFVGFGLWYRPILLHQQRKLPEAEGVGANGRVRLFRPLIRSLRCRMVQTCSSKKQ